MCISFHTYNIYILVARCIPQQAWVTSMVMFACFFVVVQDGERQGPRKIASHCCEPCRRLHRDIHMPPGSARLWQRNRPLWVTGVIRLHIATGGGAFPCVFPGGGAFPGFPFSNSGGPPAQGPGYEHAHKYSKETGANAHISLIANIVLANTIQQAGAISMHMNVVAHHARVGQEQLQHSGTAAASSRYNFPESSRAAPA